MVDEMIASFPSLLTQYPSGMKVNSLLASKCWGIKEEYIIPGNGAAELIKALMELLPGTLGITRPIFEEYPNRRKQEELVTFIPHNNEYRYTADDLMAFYGEHHVENLLLVNPDNPSGNFNNALLGQVSANQNLLVIAPQTSAEISTILTNLANGNMFSKPINPKLRAIIQ